MYKTGCAHYARTLIQKGVNMQFNTFNLYSMNSGMNNIRSKDEIDTCIDSLVKMNEYNEVKEFLSEKFGNIENEKWFEYSDLKKAVYIKNDDNVIEFCALKNEKQYFGKGWKLIQ